MKKILIKLAIIVLATLIVVAIIESAQEDTASIKKEESGDYYDHYDRL